MRRDGLQSNGGKAGVGVTHLLSLKAAHCCESAPNCLRAGPGLGPWEPDVIAIACARGSWECCTELLVGVVLTKVT